MLPINNAEVRFAFAEDQEQVDKLLEVREQCPQLQHIYFDDPRGLRNYDQPGLAGMDELQAAGKAFAAIHPAFFRDEVAKITHTDVAAMFFTSGTTGNPKGVLYSHRALALSALSACMPGVLSISARETILPVVPMFHITGMAFGCGRWVSVFGRLIY